MVAADSSNLVIPARQQQQLSPQQLPFMHMPASSILGPGMDLPTAPAGAAVGVGAMAAAAAAAVGHSTGGTGSSSGCHSPVTPPLLGTAPHWLAVNRILQASGDYAESVASMASSSVLEHLTAAGL